MLKRIWLASVLAPVCAWSAPDLTFFATSDTHYGTEGADWVKNRNAMPDILNALPGKNYPASVGGGKIAVPNGILIPGDLVDRPDTTLWKQYQTDYGVNKEGRVKFPVYDGLGNHDGPGPQALIVDLFKVRNRLRLKSPGITITATDSAQYNYSWDWDQVHFVNLNLYSGSIQRTRDEITGGQAAFKSLDFLKQDLEKNVGKSGRPVFIMQHYTFDGTSLGGTKPWWSPEDAQLTYDLIKDYNVIALLHGHSHGKKIYKWNGIDVFDDGTTQNGDAFIFRILGDRMFVVNILGQAWGDLKFEKTISLGQPVAVNPGKALGGRETAFSGPSGEVLFHGTGPMQAEVLDLHGRRVWHGGGTGGELRWDGTTTGGNKVPAGVYLVRLASGKQRREMRLMLDGR